MTDLDKILCYENFDNRSGALSDIPGFAACKNGSIEGGVGRTWIGAGKGGWSEWGYEWKDSTLQECVMGDHIWWRLEILMPHDFVVDSGPGMLKMFRFGRRVKGSDTNRGYVDWYIGNGSDNYKWQATCESDPPPPEGTPGKRGNWVHYPTGRVTKGKKQLFEFYTYFHPTNGIMRAWCDGVMFADTKRHTMRSDSFVNRLLFMTYYNNGSPKTQGLQFDHHTVAVKNRVRDDSVHLSTDAQGNRFIGTTIRQGGDIVTPPIDPTDPTDPTITPPGDLPLDPTISPVTFLRASDITRDSMTVSWQHDGRDIDGYVVYRRLEVPGSAWEQLAMLDANTRSCESTGLPEGTRVHYQVAAGRLSTGVSAWRFTEATTLSQTDPVDPVDPVDPPDPITPGPAVATMQVMENGVYVTTDLPVVVVKG